MANFTVLDEDPYAVPPERLKDVPVWGTVFEGRVFPVLAANRGRGKAATATAPSKSASHAVAPWEGHDPVEGEACHLAEISQLFIRVMSAPGVSAP